LACTGCEWTSKWNCPGQAKGSEGNATVDGSPGYRCCCEFELYDVRVKPEDVGVQCAGNIKVTSVSGLMNQLKKSGFGFSN